MSDATELILKQFGGFGALLLIAGYVIRRLWSDAADQARATIATLSLDNKALTLALAESNAARLADHTAFTTQLLNMARDTVSGLTNASNAVEASTEVLSETKIIVRDVTEELRRRPRAPGG